MEPGNGGEDGFVDDRHFANCDVDLTRFGSGLWLVNVSHLHVASSRDRLRSIGRWFKCEDLVMQWSDSEPRRIFFVVSEGLQRIVRTSDRTELDRKSIYPKSCDHFRGGRSFRHAAFIGIPTLNSHILYALSSSFALSSSAACTTGILWCDGGAFMSSMLFRVGLEYKALSNIYADH